MNIIIHTIVRKRFEPPPSIDTVRPLYDPPPPSPLYSLMFGRLPNNFTCFLYM